MTRTTDSGQDGNRPEEMPWGLAEKILRPDLPSLSEEIIEALREKIPEYARPMDGPYGQIMRTGVEQALSSFVDRIADPGTSLANRDEVARMLGRHQAQEGRSLDSLQAAYRVGSQVAWQRAMTVGHEADLDAETMSRLANAVFGYMDELAELSVQGYRELRAASAEEQQAARRRLVHLILDGDQPVPHRALVDLAEEANWPLPELVTAVAGRAPETGKPSQEDEAPDETDRAGEPAGPGPVPAEGDVLASLDEG